MVNHRASWEMPPPQWNVKYQQWMLEYWSELDQRWGYVFDRAHNVPMELSKALHTALAEREEMNSRNAGLNHRTSYRLRNICTGDIIMVDLL